MNKNQSLSTVSQVLMDKNSFVILLNSNPSLDAVCAGLSLFLSLNKSGKNATIACSSKINYPGVFEIDKIKNQITSSGNTLIVSFPYVDGAVDKVSYQIENECFNLIIQPKDASTKLNASEVKFDYSGDDFEVLITINAPSLNGIGNIYLENKEKINNKEIINIDRNNNENYGSVNLIENMSMSEIIFNLLKNLSFDIDNKVASNLYNGLLSATNNLTASNVHPETYEACAFLTRKGAAKFTRINGQNPQPVHHSYERGGSQKIVEVENKEVKKDDTQKDWLKPNIFKSGNLTQEN